MTSTRGAESVPVMPPESPLAQPPRRPAFLDPDGIRGALIVGLFATVLASLQQLHNSSVAADLDQILAAARALLAGEDPYAAVGPGRPFEWRWPLFYPLPAVLIAAPFSPFSFPVARVLFTGVGATIFGYAITRGGHYWRLPFCLSAAFLMCIWRTQWAMYLTAAFFLPLAALFLVAKPNFAVPFVAGIRTRRQFAILAVASVVLVGVALLSRPDWIEHWIAALRTKEFVSAPVTNPGGFLLLLSLLRWRRPEARIFAALALVPQTPSFYDLLPLLVVPRTLRETSILALLISVLFCAILGVGPAPTYYDFSHSLEKFAVWIVYIPALVMLLRRPNTFDVPEPEPSPRKSAREWAESLPRLDFLLLLANVTFTAAYLWAFLTT